MKKENIENPINTKLVRKNQYYLTHIINSTSTKKILKSYGYKDTTVNGYTGNTRKMQNGNVLRVFSSHFGIDENILSNYDLEQYQFECNPDAISNTTYGELLTIFKNNLGINIPENFSFDNVETFFDLFLANKDKLDNKDLFHRLINCLRNDNQDIKISNITILYFIFCKYLFIVFGKDYLLNIRKVIFRPLKIRNDFIAKVESTPIIKDALRDITIEFETEIKDSLNALRLCGCNLFLVNITDVIFYFFENPNATTSDKILRQKLKIAFDSIKSKKVVKSLYNLVKGVYKYKKLKTV